MRELTLNEAQAVSGGLYGADDFVLGMLVIGALAGAEIIVPLVVVGGIAVAGAVGVATLAGAIAGASHSGYRRY